MTAVSDHNNMRAGQLQQDIATAELAKKSEAQSTGMYKEAKTALAN